VTSHTTIEPMTIEELRRLLASVGKVRIGIIGDFCLDAYWTMEPALSEKSIETGLMTNPVVGQRYSPGGAGNVLANLRAIGVGSLAAFGVIGPDPFGVELRSQLEALGADTSGLLVQHRAWDTPTYIKPLVNGQESGRFDFSQANILERTIGESLVSAIESALPSLDLVVINEQLASGIHDGFFREALRSLIGRHPEKKFLIDGRSLSDFYDGTIRKINDREAMKLSGREIDPGVSIPFEEIAPVVEALGRKWGKPLFVTRGECGVLVYDGRELFGLPGIQILSEIDTVGAGDSAMAGIASALAAGSAPPEAAQLGNLVAGVTVQKLHTTGTASPAEILALGTDTDYVREPELARDSRRARFFPDTEIEIVGAKMRPSGFDRVIFDHDGTISVLRQGWEPVMERMMMAAILGEKAASVPESVYREVAERVRDFIDKTTGIQTIEQMTGLRDMVGRFGFVPADEILDAKGYKDRYTVEILEIANKRLERVERGELSLEDVTLKGAVPFLEALVSRGVELYLLSGTDHDDVEREAKRLGYAGLFGGRIYGSVGDVSKDAKKVVLSRILDEIGAGAMARVAAFGDGPVEMREIRKRGGFAVGVASDEVRRYGGNPAKRERLIRAGADIVIPDFSCAKKLMDFLGF
jgi:bifunctional ADP-heptose synthase (sugar kinase/adenylyltransferase)/phosphoglycolate phosphatase-like HAD superfamily hydrolase